MEYSIKGLPLNFYFAKTPASTSRDIKQVDLADKYGYENFPTGYADAFGDATSSAWGTPTESQCYDPIPLATPESAGLPIKDSTTYSRYEEKYIMKDVGADDSLEIYWTENEGVNRTTLKSNSYTTIKAKSYSTPTTVSGDGVWLFIQAPGGGGGGGDNWYIKHGNKGKPGGGGGGGGAACWVWLNAKKLYEDKGNAARFLIVCDDWRGGAAGKSGKGFTSGANGCPVNVFVKYEGLNRQILTVGGGYGGGGHSWDEGRGYIGTGGAGGTAIINNPDLFHAYAYVNPLPELIGKQESILVGVNGCAGGNGTTDKPSSGPVYTVATPGGSYDKEYALILNPIDDSPTYLRTSDAASRCRGVGTDPNGIGGGGGASVACEKEYTSNFGYGYGGKGSQGGDDSPTSGGRGIVFLLENSYDYLAAPIVSREESIGETLSRIIYTIYNPNEVCTTLHYKIGDADWQATSIGDHESKTIKAPFRLLLTSKFALCTDASSQYPPMTSPIVTNTRTPKRASISKYDQDMSI